MVSQLEDQMQTCIYIYIYIYIYIHVFPAKCKSIADSYLRNARTHTHLTFYLQTTWVIPHTDIHTNIHSYSTGVPWTGAGQYGFPVEKIKMRGPRNSMRHVDIARATHAANLTQVWRRSMQAQVMMQYRHLSPFQGQVPTAYISQRQLHMPAHSMVVNAHPQLYAQQHAVLGGQAALMTPYVSSAAPQVSQAGAFWITQAVSARTKGLCVRFHE